MEGGSSTKKLQLTDLEVAVAPELLDRSTAGGITGLLAVRLGSTWLPERTWSDFPVVVLGWWMRECAGLASGGTGRFRFMDGPLQFNANAIGGGRVELESEDQHGNNVRRVVHATVPVSHVRAFVLRAAAQILDACKRNRWSGRDVDELRSLVESAVAEQGDGAEERRPG